MPLIKPEIQKALRAANLLPGESDSDENLKQILSDTHLTPREILQELRETIDATEGSTRVRCIELAAKINNMTKDNVTAAVPTISIIIQDPNAPVGINPILLPRTLNANS